jgi:two-component sensor histidine kinase
VQQALPLAVVVATVVAATVNHNFPQERRGTITVSTEASEERVTITVSHQGGDPLHHAADSLSDEADLIDALVSQIDGRFESSEGSLDEPAEHTVHTVSAPTLIR